VLKKGLNLHALKNKKRIKFKTKIMKKLILSTLAVVTLMLTTQMNAQTKEGLFFSLNTGYVFGTSTMSGLRNSTQLSSTNTTREGVKLSFGKGFNIGGSVGYMFNKNLGAELGINYLIGGKTTTTSTFIGGGNTTSDWSAKMLQFKPTLIIAAGMEKINPYAKFGILIGSGSIQNDDSSTGPSFINTTKETYDGGTAFGFHGGIGVNYTINAKISLFGELNMINMSYAPTKSKLTEDVTNGVNNLVGSAADVRNTETEYVDSYNTGDVIPSTSPSKSLKNNFAFGSFGFNFGVKYSL
jgi:outer membrane protein W